MGFFRRAALWTALVSMCPASRAWAEGDAVDPKVALSIMLRVVTYDRALKPPAAAFVVLIPAEKGLLEKRDRLLAAAQELNLSTIQGHELKFVGANLKDAADLTAAVNQAHPSALLAVPGSSAALLSEISRLAPSFHLYTLSLDPTAVEQKLLLLGVSAKDDGKPQIVINLVAARSLGAVFENSVLRLARLIQ